MKKIVGYLFYIIGFFLVYRFTNYGLNAVVESIKFDEATTVVGTTIGLLIVAVPIFFLLKYANRWTNLNRNYFVSVFVLISIFSFISEEEVLPFNYDNEYIIWSEKNVDWTNFTEVKSKSDGFSASIYSEIFCPREITEKSSAIYAYMSPSISDKLNDSLLGPQLLIHEQYHFNITEYYTRLLRKAIIETGSDELTIDEVQSLYDKYELKRDSIQDLYDSISDHNVKNHEQRYWELKIDEMLRGTEYYSTPDVYNYYNFDKGETNFYRQILQTFNSNILTSYPIYKEEIKYGESYEVIESWNTTTVKFYKDGKLNNGGTFKTAITKITKNWFDDIEIHYYNADESYNSKLDYCIYKRSVNDDDIRVNKYFNKKEQRVEYEHDIYEIQWEFINDTIAYSTYYNKDGISIPNKDKVYHVKKYFDKKERVFKYESYDVNDILMNDVDNISIYEFKYTNNHMYKAYKKYNKFGKHPINSDSYNLEYVYDERGLMKKRINFDENNLKINDDEGVCIHDYCYDIYGNTTQTKRYNKMNLPVLGDDDYFQWVTKYDSIGRVTFDAKYYMENTLRFYDDNWGASKLEYPNDSLIIKYNLDAYNNLFNDDTGVAIVKKYKNSKKETIKDVYFDKNESYAKTKTGVVQYLYKYDDNGNQIEEVCLDSLGSLKAFQADVAKVCWAYDANNNKIKTSYYNEKDKLANANKNAAFNFYSYNDNNKVIERSYYNKKMEPLMYEGAFKTRYLLNKKGNDSVIKKYDINNNFIKGVCVTKYKYNVYDNVIVESYYNDENNRANNSDGISAIKYNYDNRQRVTGHDYFDIHDSIVNNKLGYSTYKKVLNENGGIVSESFFDKSETSVLGPNGYHKKEVEWNEMDLDIKVSLFNVDNTLIEDDEGIAIYEFPRAKSSLLKVDRFYNKNHELTEDNSGAAEIYYQPNLNGLYYLGKRLNAKGEVLKN